MSSVDDLDRHWGPAARDTALRRSRRLTGGLAVAAAALTGSFSVVAAQAFKGHSHRRATPAVPSTTQPRTLPVAVPPPQHVPPIAPARTRLRPPSSPPAAAPPAPAPPAPSAPTPAPPSAAPPAPAPAPTVSGGS